MINAVRQEDLKKIDAMTIIEAVAYANRLSSKLKCTDCSDEEKRHGLELLGRLTERVHFLKITLNSAHF